MKRTHTLLAALLLGLMLILAGCGSDGGSDGDVASATASDTDTRRTPASASDEDPAGARSQVRASACASTAWRWRTRKDGRITIKAEPGQEETMKKAQEACQKYLPQISDADRKAATEDGAASSPSACVRTAWRSSRTRTTG